MEFYVEGPFVIKKERLGKGKYRLLFEEFWKSGQAPRNIANERGVYVFAAKTGRGYMPLYVGKATKSFAQEVFNPTNKHKYSDSMLEYERCKPVLFFVVQPSRRGNLNVSVLDEVETFLIQSAYAKNPDIQNIQKTKTPSWSIRGAVRNNKRGTPASSIEFKKAIGL